ncbi:hypothetical protein BFJ71_g16446, partial [Fusarium oxysporum]
ASFTPENIASGWRRTGLKPFDPDVVLSQVLKNTDDGSDVESGLDDSIALQEPTARELRRLVDHVVKQSSVSSDTGARKLKRTLESLQAEVELLKHENQGLRETIIREKQRRQRGKALKDYIFDRVDPNSAQVFSPQKIAQVRQKKVEMEAQKEEEALQKRTEKALRQKRVEEQKQLVLERKRQREEKKERKRREKETKQLEREANRQLRTEMKKQNQRSIQPKHQARQNGSDGLEENGGIHDEIIVVLPTVTQPPVLFKPPNEALSFIEIIDDTEEIVRSFCKDNGESSSADESDGDAPEHPFQERDECTSTIDSHDVRSYGAFFRTDKEAVPNDNASPGSLTSDVVGPCDQDKAFNHFDLVPPVLILSPPDLTRTPLIPAHWIADLPIAPFSLGQAISRGVSPEPEPRFPVSQTMKVDLMSAYIKETATWCETTDSEMHFSARSVHEMMDSKPFVAAAMSLASRQLDVMQGFPRHITLELYQYTIRLLLGHDPAEADSSILATCTILCVYELMASSVSEWRRHLKGCAGLLRLRKWNGNSEGIVKACFWAFARIDVWAAFFLNQTTLIPTDSWVDEESLVLVAEKGDTDDYCNLAILIFAKIINVLNEEDGAGVTSLAEPREKAQAS